MPTAENVIFTGMSV